MRWLISLMVLCLMVSCTSKGGETEQLSLMDASKQELASAVAERDQLLGLVRDISACMDDIRKLEKILTLTGTQPTENAKKHTQLLADIAIIKQTLRQRRLQLAELEERLKESSLYTEDLQSTIAVLRKQLDVQSSEVETLVAQLKAAHVRIDSLTNAVDSLNTTVSNVSLDYEKARKNSEMLEAELNTCYYACATKSELREHKIIETGFLKKTKLLKNDFDKAFFSVGDKRDVKQIKLNSKKAKIHTNHPDGSFFISQEENGHKTINITDADEFWSLTNYLVVETD